MATRPHIHKLADTIVGRPLTSRRISHSEGEASHFVSFRLRVPYPVLHVWPFSLAFLLDKLTPEESWGVSTNRYSRPIGRRSQCAAIGTRSTRVTITFLGEQQDIIDPEAAILVAGQTTSRQSSVLKQPVDDLSGRP